jgi:hypothetical protein
VMHWHNKVMHWHNKNFVRCVMEAVTHNSWFSVHYANAVTHPYPCILEKVVDHYTLALQKRVVSIRLG